MTQCTQNIITSQKIQSVANTYRFSKEERSDVLKWYILCDGDMNMMLQYIMLSDDHDIYRFVEIIKDEMAKGTIKELPKFKKYICSRPHCAIRSHYHMKTFWPSSSS